MATPDSIRTSRFNEEARFHEETPKPLIYLDTSFLVVALVPGTECDTQLREWLASGESLGMSAVAWAEFNCGPIDAVVTPLARELITHIAPFDEADADIAAVLFNRTGRKRGSLADCMIAARAIREEAPLATMNRVDFGRFAEFQLDLVG